MAATTLFDLSGRVAIVTGGSRGLGLEMATGLGEFGARVAITARREAWLGPAEEQLAAQGIEVVALQADVSRPDHAESVVRQVLDRFGRLDLLVNNAGISWGAPAESMPLDRWVQVMAVNVTGAFLMAQAAFEPMRRQGGGRIVNVASVSGLVGTPPGVLDAVGYSASKGALIALTRDLAVKWAPHGIRVNAIAPGFFPTRMTEGLLSAHGADIEARIPLGRVGREGELKGVVVFLASAAADYITGQVLAVDGGLTAA
jgi:gluconate 5-dehydrogenase